MGILQAFFHKLLKGVAGKRHDVPAPGVHFPGQPEQGFRLQKRLASGKRDAGKERIRAEFLKNVFSRGFSSPVQIVGLRILTAWTAKQAALHEDGHAQTGTVDDAFFLNAGETQNMCHGIFSLCVIFRHPLRNAQPVPGKNSVPVRPFGGTLLSRTGQKQNYYVIEGQTAGSASVVSRAGAETAWSCFPQPGKPGKLLFCPFPYTSYCPAGLPFRSSGKCLYGNAGCSRKDSRGRLSMHSEKGNFSSFFLVVSVSDIRPSPVCSLC